jgi:hypothetical protein
MPKIYATIANCKHSLKVSPNNLLCHSKCLSDENFAPEQNINNHKLLQVLIHYYGFENDSPPFHNATTFFPLELG